MKVLSKDNFIIYWFSHVIPPTDNLLRELYEKALIKKQEENSVFAACDQDYPPVVCFEQLPKGTMAVVIFLLASTDDIRCLQLLEDIMHTSNNKNCLHEVIEGLPQPAYRGDLTPEERAATFSEILQGMLKYESKFLESVSTIQSSKTKLLDLYDSRVVLCEYSTLDDIVTDPFALSKATVFKLHSRYFVIANQLSEYKKCTSSISLAYLKEHAKNLGSVRTIRQVFS